MLYTRKGDGGTSGLFGTKERLPKDNPVYDALGSLDELNSMLGYCYARAQRLETTPSHVPITIRTVQRHIFNVQAELAGAEKTLAQPQIEWLEDTIARLERQVQNPHAFVIPGATELSGLFDWARAVARRAERAVIHAHDTHKVSVSTHAYLNRLSSLMYVLARYMAALEGKKESSPTY